MSDEKHEVIELVVKIKADASELLTGLDVVGNKIDEIKAKLESLKGSISMVGPDAIEVIDRRIRQAAPSIAEAAHAAVFAEIERGGKAARVIANRDLAEKPEEHEENEE